MCGRYQFTEPQNADLRRILQDVRRRCGDRAQDFRFGDVMPTAAAPVLMSSGFAWGCRTAMKITPLTIPTGRPCATRPTTRPMLFSFSGRGICGLT